MNFDEAKHALAEADPGAGVSHGDYGPEPVYILDEDGFQHIIKYVTWDQDDRCFYISTRFKR